MYRRTLALFGTQRAELAAPLRPRQAVLPARRIWRWDNTGHAVGCRDSPVWSGGASPPSCPCLQAHTSASRAQQTSSLIMGCWPSSASWLSAVLPCLRGWPPDHPTKTKMVRSASGSTARRQPRTRRTCHQSTQCTPQRPRPPTTTRRNAIEPAPTLALPRSQLQGREETVPCPAGDHRGTGMTEWRHINAVPTPDTLTRSEPPQ